MGRHHAPHRLATHAMFSHTESNHNTNHQAGGDSYFSPKYYAPSYVPAFALNKKQIFSGTVKECVLVFVFVPVFVKIGYVRLIGK